MKYGHGDDIGRYPQGSIRWNMSSNVPAGIDHSGLFQHLAEKMPSITNYPEPTPHKVEQCLAQHLHIDEAQICVTNGATEAIYLIAQAFERHRSSIQQPTFAEYADACRLHHHTITHTDAQLHWLCNPNNPTGSVTPHQLLLEQIDRHPETLFVVDQSYACFTKERTISIEEATQRPNVILLYSMTKEFAVPGLRIGYVVASNAIIERIKRLRLPWSMSQLAQEAAIYLLSHSADYALPIDTLLDERQRLATQLEATRLIEVWPSDCHILLCKLRMGNAAALKEYLATTHGILIRDASNFEGLDKSFFRIAVQGREASDALLRAITQWFEE